MRDKELDKVLKEKLQDIKPSPEFELKVIRSVEKEKQKVMEEMQDKKEKFTPTPQTSLSTKSRVKWVKNFGKVLSMAAVAVIVFTLGVNLKTAPNVGDSNSLVTIKAIKPTNLESGTLANDSEFIIEVEGENLNTEAVQKSVYVEPALDYTIEKTLNKNEYKLKFKQNIPDNTLLKLQYVKNQITEDSWAYQTSNKLSVTKTYPDNESNAVSKKTIIDVEFSYSDVENFKENVKITPNTQGSWKHLGKIWRFTPNKALKENQKYVVTINKNVKSGEQTLGEDYKFSFTIDGEYSDRVDYQSISLDGITTAKTDEKIKVFYYTFGDTNAKINNSVEIYKFQNADDFIGYLNENDESKATKFGNYDVSKKVTEGTEYTRQNYLEFNKFLPKGYYLAKVKSKKDKELFTCPIQITEYSAYGIETERDVLVWVARGNNLAKDLKVEYQGKTEKTDSDGIARFEDIQDGTEKIKYAKIQDELVIGIYNYDKSNYPSAYVYTDRPLYKGTDTINIWGFVPRKLFYDKIDEDEFYIVLDEEEKQKVKIDKNGSFQTKIELKNHVDLDFACVSLRYKDIDIGLKYISIENYELQNYDYEVICDKNYGYKGETLKFDVKVKHITGLMVPNKKVAAVYGDNTIIEKTGEDGIAHFEIKLENYEDFDIRYETAQGVSIYNGDEEEYTNAEVYLDTYLITRNAYTDVLASNDGYKAVLYKLDDSKKGNVEYGLKEIYSGTYETEVTVNVEEEVEKRVIKGYEYNEYTKENEPEYGYETTAINTNKIKSIISKNGVVEVKKDEFSRKEDTEDTIYNYEIKIIYKDLKGREIEETLWYYDEYNSSYLGYYNDVGYTPNVDTDLYSTYRYLLKNKTEDFKVGDNTTFTLAESTKSGIKDIQNSGKLLNIVFKENITKVDITTENKIKYTFREEDFPGCNITSAYFVNGKFYRMPVEYFDFNEETKKVDIEITSDKEKYAPGEEVKLKVKTTKDGKGVKSTVNISIVNEAIFKIEEDIPDLLETIYSNKLYPVYTYSSYKDNLFVAKGGEGGGGGETRSKFADTAHFETINTNGSGIAEIKFKLPDNVTSYRVTAQSANEDLEIGTNTKTIVSTLDFFVQSVSPRGLKISDDAVLNATAIADKKYKVDYEFTIKELNKTLTTKGNTNAISTVNFGKLPYGTYHAVIKGKYENFEDAIEYEFKVAAATQEVYNKTTMNVNSSTTIKPTKNPIVLEIYNKNSSKYMEYLDFIETTRGKRSDTQIAYIKAQDVKNRYYGTESSTRDSIGRYIYQGDKGYLKALENSKEDIVLTALVKFYAKEYYGRSELTELDKNDNIFEYYLLLAAEGKPILKDLEYMKAEENIANYNKILVTLAFEFEGDFAQARELYSTIKLTEEESKEYKSLIAIIETFINKKEVTNKIDDLIKNSPADEYLRFAILSFFNNNSAEIGKEENVKIISKNLNETLTLNGMQVETYTIYDEDLSDIKFETDSNDLMVSYYYQTLLENIENKNIKKDIRISGRGDLEKGNTVNLTITFEGNYSGDVRIALPNSLRLAKDFDEWQMEDETGFGVVQNNIDYIVIYKGEKCKSITLPLLVIAEGNYKFESVVCALDGIYHVSNSLNLNIK